MRLNFSHVKLNGSKWKLTIQVVNNIASFGFVNNQPVNRNFYPILAFYFFYKWFYQKLFLRSVPFQS
jgi:hypothetical protein